MGLVEKRYFKIPLEELKGIDEIFFSADSDGWRQSSEKI